MAKTRLDLRTGVRMYLDEAAQAIFLDSELNASINYAYHTVVSDVMRIWEDYYTVTTPRQLSMVASQQEYPVDSDIIKITRVELNYSPTVANSQFIRAIAVKRDEALLALSTPATMGVMGSAAYYFYGKQQAQKIGFLPIPTVSDVSPTQSIRYWGIALPSDMTADTDAIDIPYADRFGELIEIGAAARMLSKGQQEETAGTKYIALFDKGRREMREFLSERSADGAQMIESQLAGSYDFQSP